MALKIQQQVTQPFMDTDGCTVLYAPGERHDLDAGLPDWVTTAYVVVDAPPE